MTVHLVSIFLSWRVDVDRMLARAESMDLAQNVIHNGVWGTLRHVYPILHLGCIILLDHHHCVSTPCNPHCSDALCCSAMQ